MIEIKIFRNNNNLNIFFLLEVFLISFRILTKLLTIFMSFYKIKYNYKIFIFIDYLDTIVEKNINHFRNVSIIYINTNNKILNLKDFQKIKTFCKIKKIKLYLIDDLKRAIRHKIDGVYLSSGNKKIFYNSKKSFVFIGSAHNQLEYYFKTLQNCKYIFLSPIFYNKKYSNQKILGPTRFNLISLNWKKNIVALGGINNKNVKNIIYTRSIGIGFMSWIKYFK